MNIELPVKCPMPAGARSCDELAAEGAGWKVCANPRGYMSHTDREVVAVISESVASDARTNLQRGFEALRNYLANIRTLIKNEAVS